MADNVTYINGPNWGTPPKGTVVKTTNDTAANAKVQHVAIDDIGSGEVSSGNSTTDLLAGDAVFTGTGEDVTGWAAIRITLKADVASATNGLDIQFSSDNTNWDSTDTYTIEANAHKTYAIPVMDQYFRLIYTNGSNPQADFHISVLYSRFGTIQSSHRVADDVKADDDSLLVSAVLKAQVPGGDFENIDATAGGNLKVSIEEIDVGTLPIETTFSDDVYHDAFGNLKTSREGNRSDTEFIYDLQPTLYDDISANSGSISHQTNSRDVLLTIGGTGGTDVAGIRKHYWVPYTPGNGQTIEVTGTVDNASIGGGTMYAFLRSTVTGSTTLQTVQQSSWTNATSGVNWDNSQIFAIDFQSLKVGRIRYLLNRGGVAVAVTEITNDNVRASGYWQYPSLPPYMKTFIDSGNTITEIGYGDELNGVGFRYVHNGLQSTATAVYVCETVKSNNGKDLFDIPGFERSVSNGTTGVTASTTMVPILSIQVASTFNSITNRGLYIPIGFDISTSNPIHYQILYRPGLTGDAFGSVDATYSGMNYDVTASAVTGGIVIDSGYASSGAANNRITSSEGLLGRTIMSLGSGTSDILTFAAERDGNNDAIVKVSWKWKEIR